ncbi:MAG: nucleotidyltransferase domain-containing protein [Methanomassiliicoccaceae archaeon]|nr:nucleotidyltransferase domain-containing protein [Methanomassiliicoccaceae archaeon]
MFSEAHKRHTIEELRSIVAPVAEKYGVDKVYLFGSVARGDHDEDSDYDFYIEKGKIRSAFVLTGFRLDLCDALGHEVDIVSTKQIDPDLMDNIMKERVKIYG